MSKMKKYAYLWVTLAIFLLSFIGHWIFAWLSFVSEQEAHNQPAYVREYVIQTARDTLENWQSEFLQLMWQVAGLAILWYVGSPQSKEADDRKEAKLDEILKMVNEKQAQEVIRKLDAQYPRK